MKLDEEVSKKKKKKKKLTKITFLVNIYTKIAEILDKSLA